MSLISPATGRAITPNARISVHASGGPARLTEIGARRSRPVTAPLHGWGRAPSATESIDFARLDVPWPCSEQDPDGGFPIAPGETLAGIVAGYGAECERSRQAVRDAGLDERARAEGNSFTLRYALTHMIEETARHCGHLDLLRESIDGQTGQ